jgi:hypothetical protein
MKFGISKVHKNIYLCTKLGYKLKLEEFIRK